jgi:hypothetical protein
MFAVAVWIAPRTAGCGPQALGQPATSGGAQTQFRAGTNTSAPLLATSQVMSL